MNQRGKSNQSDTEYFKIGFSYREIQNSKMQYQCFFIWNIGGNIFKFPVSFSWSWNTKYGLYTIMKEKIEKKNHMKVSSEGARLVEVSLKT